MDAILSGPAGTWCQGTFPGMVGLFAVQEEGDPSHKSHLRGSSLTDILLSEDDTI